MSNLNDIFYEFVTVWKVLDIEWVKAKDIWKDIVRDYFEKEYWKELEEEMQIFIKTMENLQTTIDEAIRATNYDEDNDFD